MTKKVQLKNHQTDASVEAFMASIQPEEKQADARKVLELMQEITGHEPKMWGKSMVGFDTYSYKYASGREGSYFATGFSPRKTALTLYIMPGYQDFSDLLANLGPHKTGKCCLYIKRLSDIDLSTLKQIIQKGYQDLKAKYPN